MYNEELENLIDAALADGVLTEKEKQILFKKAQKLGVDLDEFEMMLDARLVKLKKASNERVDEGASSTSLSSQILENRIEQIKKEAEQRKDELNHSGISAEPIIDKDGDLCRSPLENAKVEIDRETSGKIENLIVSYPVPNSKDDLLDFISYLQVKKDIPRSSSDRLIGKAYVAKYNQCFEKAKQLFPDDPIVKAKIEEEQKKRQENEKKAAEEEKEYRKYSLIRKIFVIIALGAIVLEWCFLPWMIIGKIFISIVTVIVLFIIYRIFT